EELEHGSPDLPAGVARDELTLRELDQQRPLFRRHLEVRLRVAALRAILEVDDELRRRLRALMGLGSPVPVHARLPSRRLAPTFRPHHDAELVRRRGDQYRTLGFNAMPLHCK
ncbi:MAG TPA: hypothetical protein VGD87_06505, partial [Archangium sp.]